MKNSKYVLEALQKAVIAAVAASSEPSLTIKMVSRIVKPPSDDKWLEVIQIVNDDSDPTWGDEYVYRGMLRLILHWPIDDLGAYEPLELAQEIANYFNKGRRLADLGSNVSVLIDSNPRFMGVMEEESEIMYPFSIRYRYYDTD